MADMKQDDPITLDDVIACQKMMFPKKPDNHCRTCEHWYARIALVTDEPLNWGLCQNILVQERIDATDDMFDMAGDFGCIFYEVSNE